MANATNKHKAQGKKAAPVKKESWWTPQRVKYAIAAAVALVIIVIGVCIFNYVSGLQDSVVAYNKYTGEGTGFRFTNMNADEMANCVLDACEVFWTDKDAWIKLQRQAMETDFSWSRAAGAYMDMYHSLHPEIDR